MVNRGALFFRPTTGIVGGQVVDGHYVHGPTPAVINTSAGFWGKGSAWINLSNSNQQDMLIHEVSHSLFVDGQATVSDTAANPGDPTAYTITAQCKP